jgi:hypothetical protein
MDRPGPPRWLELLSYLLLATGAVLPALLSPGHIIGDGVDMYGTFWFYWWIQECLIEWKDPGFTKLFFFPLGKDIFAHTGNNFVDAVFAQPFQWLFGYPRYQPIYVAAMMLANALSFRPLAGHALGRGTWAAWASVMLWMLAPYALFEFMTGRLTQSFLVFLPLALYHFLRIGEGRWRDPLLCGLFTGLAGWTYWFNGYFLALAMAWLAICQLIEREHPVRRLVLGWVAAAGTCFLTILPAAREMSRLASKGKVPGLSDGSSVLGEPSGVANNVSDSLHGYLMMELHGQPMLGYLVWGVGGVLFLIFGRQRLRWGGLALVTLAFSIGPRTPTDPSIVMPHYMLAYGYLPFFDRLWFPYRMLGVTFVGLSLGLGSLVGRLSGWRWVWLLPGALAMLTIVEQHRHLAYPLLHRDLTPPRVYAEIGRVGGALLEVPVGVSKVSIAFQPVHGQPVFGGMGENAMVLWPPGFNRRMSNTFIQFLRSMTRDPQQPTPFRKTDITTFKAEGFRWVVMDRQLVESQLRQRQWAQRVSLEEVEQGAFIAQRMMVSQLGEPWAVEGRLVVWDLVGGLESPQGLAPTEATLWEKTWEPEEMPAYERHLRDLGRLEGQ